MLNIFFILKESEFIIFYNLLDQNIITYCVKTDKIIY